MAAKTNIEGKFLFIISATTFSMKRRRQSGSFTGYNGRATSACSQASTLILINGQLFLTYANGTVAQYSANSNDNYVPLIPSTNPGNVTTTFSLSNTGTLLWNNDYFFQRRRLVLRAPLGSNLSGVATEHTAYQLHTYRSHRR